MNKREAKFTTKLIKWINFYYKNSEESLRAEVKVVNTAKSPNYAYNSDKSFAKEMRNLLQPRNTVKFSDLGGMGTVYDLVSVASPGYFIIHFERRGNKRFYMIEARVLDHFIRTNKPKSITESNCKGLGGICDLH